MSLVTKITLFFTFLILPIAPILVHAEAASTTICADGTSGCIKIPDPVNVSSTDPVVIIGTLIRSVLLIIGAVTLFMFVWGSFHWLISAGNEDRIEKGSQTMLWAAIGIFLVFASYVILTTYLNLLTGK